MTAQLVAFALLLVACESIRVTPTPYCNTDSDCEPGRCCSSELRTCTDPVELPHPDQWTCWILANNTGGWCWCTPPHQPICPTYFTPVGPTCGGQLVDAGSNEPWERCALSCTNGKSSRSSCACAFGQLVQGGQTLTELLQGIDVPICPPCNTYPCPGADPCAQM